MKRFAKLILVAMAINWAILFLSVRLFHDDRNIFRSVRVGSELSVDALERFSEAGECRSSRDNAYTVCDFRDFWYKYKVFIDHDRQIAGKQRFPVPDLVYPASFLHSRQRQWLYETLALLLAAALLGSIWFVYSGWPRPAH